MTAALRGNTFNPWSKRRIWVYLIAQRRPERSNKPQKRQDKRNTGSSRCAVDDEAARRFGRDDVFFCVLVEKERWKTGSLVLDAHSCDEAA
jgi:hypothetical protein